METGGGGERGSTLVPVGDGLRLRVEDRGTGAATLLLHGFTGSVEAWGEEILSGLAARDRRVVTVDLPGHGGSDVPGRPERTAMERVVDDLCRVLDARGLERADWVGYSMGGRIALAAAVLRPGRVGRLVLEGASPGLASARDREARRRRDEALARRILDEGIEAFVDRWMDLPLFRSQEKLPAARIQAARERRLRCDPRGLASSLRGLGTGRQPSFWDDLAHVDRPVLLVTGEADAKFTGIAERMEARLPDARHRVIPGAGHTVHFEAPDAWLEEVAGFLDGRRPETHEGGART